MVLAGFIILMIGVILIICYPISKSKNTRCSARAQGTLVGIFETDSSNGNVGHGYVYSYYVNGIEYQLKSTAYNSQVDNVGDQCTIWYNPAKPKDAQAFHYDSDKVYKIILIIGVALVVLGIVLIGFGFVQSIS